MAADAGGCLEMPLSEADDDSRRDGAANTEALGHTEGDREANVGEVGRVSRPAYTRPGAKHPSLGEDQIDKIAKSEEEPGNRVAAEEATTTRRRFAQKRTAVEAASAKPRKRRCTSRLGSAQKRRVDVAFRESSHDSAWTQMDDTLYPPDHGHFDFEKMYRRRPQDDIGKSRNRGRAPQVESVEAVGTLSDTTQEMDWSLGSPKWHLSTANLQDLRPGADESMQCEISGDWKLTVDGKLALLGSTPTAWQLCISRSLQIERRGSTIDVDFGMLWDIQPIL